MTLCVWAPRCGPQTSQRSSRLGVAVALLDCLSFSRARRFDVRQNARRAAGWRRLADDGLEVGEDFELELVEALTERAAEVGVAVLAALEGGEVRDHALEPVAGDEVVGHQEGELVGRQRALAQVAD